MNNRMDHGMNRNRRNHSSRGNYSTVRTYNKNNNKNCIQDRNSGRVRLTVLLAAVVVLFAFMFVFGVPAKLFGSSSQDSMNSVEAETLKEKYYTSIEIQKGDTLWDLAETYGRDYMDHSVFIDEVKTINKLSDDRITAGAYLFIPVYR